MSENERLREEVNLLKSIDASKIYATIELSDMNVVYRGLWNPIKISVPGALKIEASAPGLKKINEYGDYILSPQTGSAVTIEILALMPDQKTILKTKTIRIKNLGKLKSTINGVGCGSRCEVLMKKEAFNNAKIEVFLRDYLFDHYFKVGGFKVYVKGSSIIEVKGSTITEGVYKEISPFLIEGAEIQIFDIEITSNSGLLIKPPAPIIVRVRS